MESSLLRAFDALVKKRESTRSEVLRDLARAEVTRAQVGGGADAVATVTLVYDHHVRDLTKRLVELQHGLGAGKLVLSIGKNTTPTYCEETYVPVEWKGRHWIAAHGLFRTGASFDGGGVAVEVVGHHASLYIDNRGLSATCDSPTNVPVGAPADWATLPVDVTRALCGYSR